MVKKLSIVDFMRAGESVSSGFDRFISHCEESYPKFNEETLPLFQQLLSMYKAQRVIIKHLNEITDKYEEGYTYSPDGEWIKPNQ